MSVALNIVPTPYIHVAKKRRKQTYYSKMDGNWNDPTIWLSNQYGTLPGVEDDVYINHTVTANVTTTVNNLFVSGTLKGTNSVVLSVLGNIQAVGTVDFTSSTINLTLYGTDNFIVNFTGGNSTVTYARTGDQNIMNISYKNLTTSNNGTKYLISNLTVGGNVNVTTKSVFELSTYDLTVNGSTTTSATLSKTGSGSLLFIGLLATNFGLISFTGNPSIELRGGFQKLSTGITNNMGNGIISFTTNNQNVVLSGGSEIVQFTNVLIVGAITVTNTNATWQINNYINGTVSGSKLLNQGTIYFNTTTLPMITGVFDYLTSNTSIVGYVMSADYTIPYTTYQGLTITGGTKTLSGDTTVQTNLSALYIDLGTYNLTVNGTTTLQTNFKFYKQSAGNILFVDKLTMLGGGPVLDLSGNPTIECRGGINLGTNCTIIGSPTFNFTANQDVLNNNSMDFAASNFVIDTGITLTLTGAGTALISGIINGNSSSSALDSRITNIAGLQYKNSTQPMFTGVLIANAATNIFKYNNTGNQEVKGTTYDTLELGGSGVKKLMGNVTVPAAKYSVTGTATVDLNGFTLTLT